MLVLSRRVNERILIENIGWVRIIGIGPGWVRLGFDMNPGVKVLREELLNQAPRPAQKEPNTK